MPDKEKVLSELNTEENFTSTNLEDYWIKSIVLHYLKK